MRVSSSGKKALKFFGHDYLPLDQRRGEGGLKPMEKSIQMGRASVRETIYANSVGTIAVCYVTLGTFERSAKVRLIRDGMVVFPFVNRTRAGDIAQLIIPLAPHDHESPSPQMLVGLESVKRANEDVAEVREGFECSLKIAGYDDVRVGDVIEAFRVGGTA